MQATVPGGRPQEEVAGIDLSVIMAVYNAMPYLSEAVESVLVQDLGGSRFELILVDDGSTDGSLELLRSYARESEHVVLMEAGRTGGPARPRNSGIECARGEFILFFDADDVLAPGALQEMLAVARENDVDIVVPKQAPIGARAVPVQAFRETLLRTDIYESDAYRVLGPVKLFRASLIHQHGLRFPESFPRKSDVAFSVESYLRARAIAILADRDYVQVRLREDCGNIHASRTSLGDHMPIVRFVFDAVSGSVPPGPGRDRLMVRHFRTEVGKAVIEGFPVEDDLDFRHACFTELADFAREFCTEAVLGRLPVRERVVAFLLREARYEELCSAAAWLASRGPAPVVSSPDGLFLKCPGLDDVAGGLPAYLCKVGPKSCVQVSFDAARMEEEAPLLRLLARMLVGNTPVERIELLLIRPSDGVRTPARGFSSFDVVTTDVRQVELIVPWSWIAQLLREVGKGTWLPTLRITFPDVSVEVPVFYMQSAKVALEQCLVADDVRMSSIPRSTQVSIYRTSGGHLGIRVEHRGRVARTMSRVIRRFSRGIFA